MNTWEDLQRRGVVVDLLERDGAALRAHVLEVRVERLPAEAGARGSGLRPAESGAEQGAAAHWSL